MSRNRYQGPKGQAQRRIWAQVRDGETIRRPKQTEDRATHMAIVRMVKRGLLEPCGGGIYRRAHRPAYRPLGCKLRNCANSQTDLDA